jgi:hypothetical protein
MPALDLALGLGMIRRAAHMLHALIFEPPNVLQNLFCRRFVRPGFLLHAPCGYDEPEILPS